MTDATAAPDELDALRPSADRAAEVKAAIAAYNAERPAIHRRHLVQAWGGTAVIGGLCLALAGGLHSGGGDPEVVAILAFSPLVLGPLAYRRLSAPARAVQQRLRSRILPVMFGFVEEVRYANEEGGPGGLDWLEATDLLSFDRSAVDDHLSGRVEDLAFELVEAELTSGSGKNRSTVFKGLIFRFRRDTPFPGRLVVAPRPTAVGRFFRGLFPPELEVVWGEEHGRTVHEYRSDNPAAAQAMIGATLERAVEWIDRTWPDGRARLAFANRDCCVLLPSARNRFELPGTGTELSYETHVEPMIWDLVRLLAIAKLVRKV